MAALSAHIYTLFVARTRWIVGPPNMELRPDIQYILTTPVNGPLGSTTWSFLHEITVDMEKSTLVPFQTRYTPYLTHLVHSSHSPPDLWARGSSDAGGTRRVALELMANPQDDNFEAKQLTGNASLPEKYVCTSQCDWVASWLWPRSTPPHPLDLPQEIIKI